MEYESLDADDLDDLAGDGDLALAFFGFLFLGAFGKSGQGWSVKISGGGCSSLC